MWLSLSVSYLRRHHAMLVSLLKKRRERDAFAVERRVLMEAGLTKAPAALGELPHAALMLWLMIQSHDRPNQCLSPNRVIKVLCSCFGTGNAITSIAIHVLPDAERDGIPGRFTA
jgi:hypothetical protein